MPNLGQVRVTFDLDIYVRKNSATSPKRRASHIGTSSRRRNGDAADPPRGPPPPGLEAAIARVPGRPGDLVAERGDRYAPQPEGSVWTYPPTRSFERKQDGRTRLDW